MRTKLLGFLTAALVFASFGLFAGAASAAKIFTIQATSIGPNQVAVTILNLTPENNSTINSIVLNKVSIGSTQYSLLSGVAADPRMPARVVASNGTLRIDQFDGLKSGGRKPDRITINVTVDTSFAPACGATPGWSAVTYTGNFSQTTFLLVDAAGTPQPSIPQSLNCFTLENVPGTIYAGTTGKTFKAKLTNTNGAGGASITALSFAPSTAGVAATATANTAWTPSGPIAPGAFATVDVTVNTSCGASSGDWTPTVAGGAVPFSGTTTSSSYAVTPCSLVFSPGPPTKVGLNSTIEPTIEVAAKAGDGTALAWDGAITWSLVPQGSAGSGSTNNAGPDATCVTTVTGGGCSEYSYSGLKVTSGTISGTYKLKATSTTLGSAVGSTSVTFDTAFTLWGGTLGCDATTGSAGALNPGALVTYVKESDQGKWGLVRGKNKDDVGCIVVPYIFDLNVTSSPQLASFIVPNPSDPPFQKVSAEFVVVWGRVAVNATGDGSSWTTKRPKLSWKTPAPPLPGTNDFVPALSCVLDPDNPDLIPTPYANGFASVPTADLDKLLPKIPNVSPFSDLYDATTCPTCIKGNPAYPQYQPGIKAAMCIAQHGWTAVGKDDPDDPDSPTLIQYWTRVIDQADGFMSLDN